MSPAPVLEASELARHYPVPRGLLALPAQLKAVDGVSFVLARGRTLAVVGESGCGKSTLARLVTLIEPPSAGQLLIHGQDVATASPAARKALRPKVQIVFQDPYGSLNPRQRIGAALEEPLRVNTRLASAEVRAKAQAMLAAVGLAPEHFERYPHMFSGGQRQRIAIARALMPDPEMVVLDEPLSALDVSVQAQVLRLLAELQARLHVAYLFISHNLTVVRHVADEVLVMYFGRPVEQGPAAALFAEPQHPYTRALLSATPVADPRRRKERIVLPGEVPSPLAPPAGCAFHPRCPWAFDRCRVERPALLPAGSQLVACHAVAEQRIVDPPASPKGVTAGPAR